MSDTPDLVIRPLRPEDFDALSGIYRSLWCNWLRRMGALDDARLVGDFNIAMQLHRSPLCTVGEINGEVVSCCLVGIAKDGATMPNEDWQPLYEELLARATERAKTADADLEGALFGDSREKKGADRFIASGDPYGAAQINLLAMVPSWQHHSLGSALMDDARRAMRSRGIERFFLTSDSQSDYAFYDHIGMRRISESHEQDTGDGFVTYIYGGETA
jgi:GNAT superfamily N-acetyltransferase